MAPLGWAGWSIDLLLRNSEIRPKLHGKEISQPVLFPPLVRVKTIGLKAKEERKWLTQSEGAQDPKFD